MKQILIVIGLATSTATGLAIGDPITTDTSIMFRDHKGPNSVGTGTGDTLTVVVPNVRPNLTTTAFATNPQVSGNIPLSNLFTSRTGFFTRSFATTISTMAGSVTAPSTITLTNGTDTLSVPTNGTAGVQQLPLLTNLAIGGPNALAPTLSWDAVPVVPPAVPYNQVRLSIYIDRTDQIIVTERVIGGPGTTSYAIPSGTLAPNTDYVFRVFLWDGYGTNSNTPLNRSSTFVNYTTTDSAVSVGSNSFVTPPATPPPVPLVLNAGVNHLPDTSINIGTNGFPGAVTLTSGTTLQGSYMTVGQANSTGTLIVDNTTVRFDGSDDYPLAVPPTSGGFLTAGRGNGRGFIDVVNGGHIEINSSDYVNPGMNIGRDPGGFGTVNVDGVGSTVVITGPATVDSIVDNNGGIGVGRQGDGRLNITGGALVANAAAGVTNVGRFYNGGRGSVLVSGAGSTLDAGAQLNISPNASPPTNPPKTSNSEGVVRIENGGLVVADVTTLGPGGLLTGSGGTLQSFLLVNGGVFAPGSSPGKMIIDGDMTVSEGLLQLEAFGPGQSDEIEVTGTITIGANATVEIQLGYTPTTPLTFLTAGTGINLDPGFAGPTVVGQLGTEAQGLDGATVQVVIGDQTFAAPVQVPPVDPGIDYDGDGVPDGIDACPGSSASANLLIGSCDTGTSNVALGNGCKISDAVRACELDARNHGGFVSCVAGNANQWHNNGLISGNQRGAIQACAAK